MIIKTNARKKYEASFEWHQWFAWYPVILDNEIVWLQKIWRIRMSSWHESYFIFSVEKPALLKIEKKLDNSDVDSI